jgi:hypothetical protein
MAIQFLNEATFSGGITAKSIDVIDAIDFTKLSINPSAEPTQAEQQSDLWVGGLLAIKEININDSFSIYPDEEGRTTASGPLNFTNNITINNNNVVKSPSTITGGVSGISNIVVMDQVSYDTLSPKLSTTLYVIV